jgi:hypothetical protein
MNIYSKIEDKKYFEENFIKIMETKFFDIYNHLNDIDIFNEEKEDQENEQENQINEENKDVNKYEDNEENKKEDKPLVLFFIEDRLQKLKCIINNTSQDVFEKIFNKHYQDYLSDLQIEQSELSKSYGVNCQAIDFSEIKKTFKEELFITFNNVFFKNIFCVIYE